MRTRSSRTSSTRNGYTRSARAVSFSVPDSSPKWSRSTLSNSSTSWSSRSIEKSRAFFGSFAKK